MLPNPQQAYEVALDALLQQIEEVARQARLTQVEPRLAARIRRLEQAGRHVHRLRPRPPSPAP